MKRPLFSCVVPVKGLRPYMGAALASLHNQGMGDDLEIIIQDADIEPDQGQSDALNKGFAKAHGEWLFWLNADDVLLPGALKKVKTVIHSTTTTSDYDSPHWITGNMVEINAEGKILRCVADRGRESAYRGLPVRTCGPSAFFRRELFEKVGGFDVTLRYCMDTDLWCKFRTAGAWQRKVNAYFWAFRIHSGSKTGNPENSDEERNRQRKETLRLAERHGIRDSRLSFLGFRLRKLLDGSYWQGWRDSRIMRGLPICGHRSLVLWAHSACRSTAVLYTETKRLAEAQGWKVTICEWGRKSLPSDRLIPFDDSIVVGDDHEKGREILRQHGGPESVQMFGVYQNSSVWRRLIVEAKRGGARVVVYSEAPCEMCLGLKAALKRLYYRFALPWKLRAAVHAAGLFISASGKMGIDRLVRLGWKREKIVPFGYASPRLGKREEGRGKREEGREIRVLHLGNEAAYRGVGIAEKAAKLAGVELVKTGGKMSEEELVAEIRRADVVVGCGYCEPWGMRINDALLEGTPVVVSDGMGVAAVCDWYGCGCVVLKGDVSAVAKVLKRCKEEPEFLAELRGGAQVAARELLPENRAKVFLNAVMFARPPEVCEANGMIVVDRLLRKHGIIREDEVWVHGMWTPDKWWKCIGAWIKGKKLVRMTHGSLSPIYLEKQGKWKKKLVAPIERWIFRHTDRVVVTCAAEKDWCQQWGLKNEFEILDLKKFFNIEDAGEQPKAPPRGTLTEYRVSPRSDFRSVRLLYLGRRHPLKGVEFLERAVREIGLGLRSMSTVDVELRIVSDHFGEELERDWAWCDVLVLPTLSENFGLVVAEALERGKKVITTDGAPAWEEGEMFECSECSNVRMGYGGRLVYLKGYRDGTDEERVELLKEALLAAAKGANVAAEISASTRRNTA